MFPPPGLFPEVRMNFTEHIFQHRTADELAIIAYNEGGTNQE
jgi:hypothetical protein